MSTKLHLRNVLYLMTLHHVGYIMIYSTLNLYKSLLIYMNRLLLKFISHVGD